MIRDALRSIARMPGLAAVVILSLGVGIGVNTAVFSWIQTMVLKPIPGIDNSASFYHVEPKSDTGTYPGMSWIEYRDLKPQLPSIEELVAFRMAPLNVGESGRTERTYAQLVSGNFFGALKLQPVAGRFIRSDEVEQPGAEPVVVLSHDYWQTYFGGAPAAVGQTIRVNDLPLTIVGVAPEGFQGTILALQFDLWVPATLAPALFAESSELDSRGQRGYSVMGRLRDGAAEGRATAELTAAMGELATSFPETNGRISGELIPYWRAPRGPQMMFLASLGILQGVMLLVLLAVCGNTANLVLARASTRSREVGIRLALGGPSGVIRLMLAESLLLGLFGSAVGIVIAWWGTEALRSMPPYGAFPVRFQTSLDLFGLAFAVVLGIGSGLLFGAAPAFQLGRIDPQQALRSGSRSAGRSAIRDGLMALQCGLALLVLVVAGLFFESFVESRDTNPGFRVEGLLLATYDLGPGNPTDSYAGQFARELLDRLRRVPSVESVALSNAMPLDIHGLPLRGFTVEGRAQTTAQQEQALSNIVSPGYFRTMGIAFVAGEDFVEMIDTTTPPQVIVNEEFVRRYTTPSDPLGRQLVNGGTTYTIAGVVKNSSYDAFGEPPTPAFFFSYRDRPRYLGEIHLRARPGSETLLASEVQRAVREIDASLPVYNIRTMAEHIERNLFLRKIPARMFVVIAPLLLALVAVGIYAVVSYSVSQRTTEIGVRIALGATSNRVVRQIVKEGLMVTSAGLILAWVIAAMVQLHLFSGGPGAWMVLMVVPMVLFAVAIFSCWWPARRVTLVDPMTALRSE